MIAYSNGVKMSKHKYSNVKLMELQSMPFHAVLPLIIDMDDAVFWAIINYLASAKA